jgi:hypothetical protein
MEHRELSKRWDSFPAVANIYQTTATTDATRDIRELVAGIGFTDIDEREWVRTGPTLMINRDPDVITLYRPSGAVQYIDSARWQTDDGASTMDTTDETAASAATREVDRLNLRGQDEYQLDRVTRLYTACGKAGTPPSRPRIIDAGVVLRRVIDGIRVEGKGGLIIVYLDREFRLTGFLRVARKIGTVHSQARGWLRVDEVLEDARAYWNPQNRNNITVTDLRLAYFENGRMSEQQIIQPTFCLDLDIQPARGGDIIKVTHYVPAATNCIGSIMPGAAKQNILQNQDRE